MTKVFHVVGAAGSGKTTLIRQIGAGIAASGHNWAVVSSIVADKRENRDVILAALSGMDFVFIEYDRADQLNAEAGEVVIRLDRMPMASDAPGALADAWAYELAELLKGMRSSGKHEGGQAPPQ